MSKTFIILEPDPVVAMDLEGALIQRFPSCHVTAGASLQEIGAAIHQCGPDTTMFVKNTLFIGDDDFKRVVQTAATRGSHIVTIGAVEDLDVPSTFVEMPFTTDMVIAAVDHVTSAPLQS
ncbi:hypothetical protein [Roseobacter sp. CCS2]|uniref:hypothetical protein n=1 Tax=Roseobacter sp. CCS2 TaxID=391593 RepID=UPI0000F3F0A3|nr:hypothetical protein [Roseobacter sp. CCS2]EBA11156.1 hypothetical protein RCCS2_10305 [Roseobacter sp. CCS2]